MQQHHKSLSFRTHTVQGHSLTFIQRIDDRCNDTGSPIDAVLNRIHLRHGPCCEPLVKSPRFDQRHPEHRSSQQRGPGYLAPRRLIVEIVTQQPKFVFITLTRPAYNSLNDFNQRPLLALSSRVELRFSDRGHHPRHPQRSPAVRGTPEPGVVFCPLAWHVLTDCQGWFSQGV
jgi:hypothetical protein